MLLALQSPGSGGVRTAIRDHMTSALRLCEAEIGRFPSYGAYERWRLAQASPRDWPSGSSIARVFKSWSAMLDALDVEPAARAQAVTMRAIGGPFTREEMLEAIGRCGRETGASPLTTTVYRRWAQARRTEDGRARVPLYMQPFTREFGSFAAAVADAGLQPHLKSKPPTGRTWYTRGEIEAALRGASQDLGEQAPTTVSYMRWRRALLEAARGRGSMLALPSDVAIYAHFSTWADALRAAGLITDDELPIVRRRGVSRSVSPARAARALLAFYADEDYGELRSHYMRWRAAQARVLGVRDAPDNWGLVRRFTSWPELMKLVHRAVQTGDPQAELERLLSEVLDGHG